jgi:hypothetical protein
MIRILSGLVWLAGLAAAQTNVVMLWPKGAPGSENWTQKEAEYQQNAAGLKGVRNIVRPSITVYLPEKPGGTSVVIAPGGGFRFLHAYNDPVSASSPSLFLAWKAAGKPSELHTYGAGGHGFGMPVRHQPTDGWIERFGDWLRFQKLM